MTGDPKPFTVSRINQAIGTALADSFPDPFWVVGEIQGYERDAPRAGQRRWGQVYFELVEKEPGADAAKASVKLIAWGDVHQRILDKFGRAASLQDGLEVKLLCAVDFYAKTASFQLKALDADPEFTLGGLERAKRELVEKLKAEGLYDQNRGVPLPPVPLTVGLITSDGSAAYHDFVQELSRSGYAFRVLFRDARMQGEETEASVVAAVKDLERDEEVDVIVLVRGGGSRTDLLWFDREKIARAVAGSSKPVVTGIGHEIDLSVADLVAQVSQKTPTAAAQFLVERVRLFETEFEDVAVGLMAAARERLEEERRSLADALRRWKPLVESRLQEARSALTGARDALAAGARRHVDVRRERLSGAGPRLGRSALGRLSSLGENLEGHGRELALKDPRRLLERGYSLLYAGGRLVKSVDRLSPGAAVEARLKDGSVEAAVTAVRKD